MDRADQIRFVKELSDNVTQSVIEQIHANKIPHEWDGIELRRLMAYHFGKAIMGSWSISRARHFKNTIIVNDL